MSLQHNCYKKALIAACAIFLCVGSTFAMRSTSSGARDSESSDKASGMLIKLDHIVDIKLEKSSQGVAWAPDDSILACLHAFGSGFEVREQSGNLLVDLNRTSLSTAPNIGFTDNTHVLTPSDDGDRPNDMFKIWHISDVPTAEVFSGPFPEFGPALNRAKIISLSKLQTVAVLPNYFGSPEPQTVVVLDLHTRTREELAVVNIIGPLDGVASLGLSPDGNTIAFGTVLGKIIIYDLVKHRRLEEIVAYNSDQMVSITAIAFNDSGTLVAGGRSAAATATSDHFRETEAADGFGIWSVSSGSLVRKYSTKNQSVRQIVWRPGGSIVSAITDSGELIFASALLPGSFWPSGFTNVLSASFSNNGEKLAVVVGNALKIFHVKS